MDFDQGRRVGHGGEIIQETLKWKEFNTEDTEEPQSSLREERKKAPEILPGPFLLKTKDCFVSLPVEFQGELELAGVEGGGWLACGAGGTGRGIAELVHPGDIGV